MDDYVAWVERAKTFLKGLAWLPGSREVADAIQPPVDDEASLSWLASPECGLPEELCTFVSTASRRCGIYYGWKPPEPWSERLQAILPGVKELRAHTDFCYAAQWKSYDLRAETLELLGDTQFYRDLYANFSPEEERGEYITLALFENGEKLALELGPQNETHGVVSVVGATRHNISDSFSQFLIDWERICYLKPTYENLRIWFDATGTLNPDQTKAAQLRDLLLTPPENEPVLPKQKPSKAAGTDYSPWLARAATYFRSLNELPGEWSSIVNIAPPLELAELELLERSLPFELPAVLRDFYLTASADAECAFGWRPDEATLVLLGEIIPYQYSLYGNVQICPAHRLKDEQWGIGSLADDYDSLGGFGPSAAAILRECVPIALIDNGDRVAFHIKAKPDDPQIVYFSHETQAEEESPIIPISWTAEEFLRDWERLGYLGPEIWLLYPFLQDSPTGLLDADSPLAEKWREFLRSQGCLI